MYTDTQFYLLHVMLLYSSVRLHSLSTVSPSPPPLSSSNNTNSSTSNVTNNLVSITSLTGSGPEEDNHSQTHTSNNIKLGGVAGGGAKKEVATNATPSVSWNISLLNGTAKVGGERGGDSKAPYLTMRSSHRRGQLDHNQWGCGFINQLGVRQPDVHYSRYNCDRDKNSKLVIVIKYMYILH